MKKFPQKKAGPALAAPGEGLALRGSPRRRRGLKRLPQEEAGPEEDASGGGGARKGGAEGAEGGD